MKTTIDIWRIKMCDKYEAYLISKWLESHTPSIVINPNDKIPHLPSTMRTKTSHE